MTLNVFLSVCLAMGATSLLFADSTTQPQTQNRDKAVYNWQERHQAICKRNQTVKPDVIFIGDSITHHWGGEPKAFRVHNDSALLRAANGKTLTNMGMGWERIENVIWRIDHGALDLISPKVVVVLLGTNNLGVNTSTEIAEGMNLMLEKITQKLPQSKIIVVGILPRTEKGLKCSVADANKAIRLSILGKSNILFCDASKPFLNDDQTLNHSLFRDGLHPNALGYERYADVLEGVVKKALEHK